MESLANQISQLAGSRHVNNLAREAVHRNLERLVAPSFRCFPRAWFDYISISIYGRTAAVEELLHRLWYTLATRCGSKA